MKSKLIMKGYNDNTDRYIFMSVSVSVCAFSD